MISDACFSFSELDSSLKQFTMARPRKKSTANAPAAEPSPPPPPPAEVKKKGRKSTASSSAPPPPAPTAVKRGSKSSAAVAQETPAKKLKLDFRHSRGHGKVLTVGQGDTGQLGLGEDVMEKSRPGLVEQVTDAVDVVAGGMHSAVLDINGKVWTFGCNDEGSLGRVVAKEEE